MADPAVPSSAEASLPVASTGLARVEAAFAAARDENRAALMPYLMGGFPDQETATAVAEAYVEAGADLIELGVPFSDPLADGPVIHAADTAALEAGATLDSVLETCAAVGDRVPVALMVYSNMVLTAGAEEFAAKAAEAGASAVIVPDLPLEEQSAITDAVTRQGLAFVPLVAPTTPPARIEEICAHAEGFVYVVSVVGTTGERAGDVGEALRAYVDSVRRHSDVPVAVGFGISTPEQAAEFGELADGVIIGTRLVREVADAPDREAAVAGVTELLRATRDALSR
jgi:tryptophan synthase alpha chain